MNDALTYLAIEIAELKKALIQEQAKSSELQRALTAEIERNKKPEKATKKKT